MMKKYLSILCALMLAVLVSCGNDELEATDATGQLIVNIACESTETEEIDFSEFHIALTPEYGMGWSAPKYGDVSWPIDVKVGTYTIGVASPFVSETETTETCYFGEAKNVRIEKDKSTEITINVELKEFQKSDL